MQQNHDTIPVSALASYGEEDEDNVVDKAADEDSVVDEPAADEEGEGEPPELASDDGPEDDDDDDDDGLEPLGTETRHMLTTWSRTELLEQGAELARLVGERDKVEADKKSANARFNAKIKELDEEISTLAEPLRDGGREERVTCELRGDWRRNEVTVYRIDTGEVVERRAMTGPERERLAQQPLPLGAGEAAEVTEVDPDGPPLLEAGEWPAALRPDPEEMPSEGHVTRAAADEAVYEAEVTIEGRRHARYDLGGGRYAFVPWPTADELAAQAEALALDAPPEPGDYRVARKPEPSRTSFEGVSADEIARAVREDIVVLGSHGPHRRWRIEDSGRFPRFFFVPEEGNAVETGGEVEVEADGEGGTIAGREPVVSWHSPAPGSDEDGPTLHEALAEQGYTHRPGPEPGLRRIVRDDDGEQEVGLLSPSTAWAFVVALRDEGLSEGDALAQAIPY